MYLCVCVFCMYEYVTCHHAYVRQDSYVCGMTHLYVRHHSLIVNVFVCACIYMYKYVTCHHAYVRQDLHVCGTTHLYVQHDSLIVNVFVCVCVLYICICDMPPFLCAPRLIYMWHDSFVCATPLIDCQ